MRCIVVTLKFSIKRPSHPDLPKQVLTIGDHIRKARIERGLTQSQVAATVQVDENSITGWELGHHDPQVRFMPKVIEFLGYNPVATECSSIGERLRNWRVEHGVSIKRLQKMLKMDRQTLLRVEFNEHRLQQATLDEVEVFLSSFERTVVTQDVLNQKSSY